MIIFDLTKDIGICKIAASKIRAMSLIHTYNAFLELTFAQLHLLQLEKIP